MSVASPTVGAALADARERLAASGAEDPRREADELYAALVCGATSRAWLDRDRPLEAALGGRLETAVTRRVLGWPQAYAAGRANFRGHWLAVDERVLIPRAETEALVELVVEWAAARRTDAQTHGRPGAMDAPSVRRSVGPPVRLPLIADVGTGSGCIAIALALEAPVAGVIATDCSADALNLAIENAAALGARDRISFRKGDLLQPLLGETVDCVVSNPPYVATGECGFLHPSVKDYEPRVALDGGADGLGLTRRLAAEARAALAPGGLFAIEVDAGRAEASATIMQDAGFDAVEIGEDLFGRPRIVHGRRSEGER